MQRLSSFWLLSLFLISGSVTLAHNNIAVIEFRENSSVVDYYVSRQLDQVYDKLPLGAEVELMVVSNHDVQLHYVESVKLSRNRCKSIADFFLKRGVEKHHLSFNAYRYRMFSERIDYNTFLEYGSPRIFRVNVYHAKQKPIRFTHSGFDAFTDEFCQYEYINSTYANVVSHDKRASLKIPANAFESISGKPFDASVVEIQFCVYQDPADFLMADITSNATMRWLESGGMVYIEAYSVGEKLKLRSGVKIELELPLIDEYEPKMTAFTGSNQYNLINWTPSISDQVRSGSMRNWDTVTIANLETGEYEEMIGFFDEDFEEEEYEETERYFMSLSNLGWINCDRFLNIQNPANQLVNVSGYSDQMAVRLVFYSENSVLPGYEVNQNGLVKWEGIPAGEKVALVVYGKRGDDFVWVSKDIIIGEQVVEQISPIILSKNELKTRMQRFAK